MKTLIPIAVLFVLAFGFYQLNESLILDYKYLDANNVSTVFRNNGSFNRNATNGNSGFEWPKGSNKFAKYASGIWLGAKVGMDTLVAIAEYDYEYVPGYTNNSGLPQGQTDPLYRIYRLSYGVNDADRMNWPNALLGNSDQGAPVYFDSSANAWKPLDFGWQTMYYVYTDSDTSAHHHQAGSTRPLKADIKQTNFSSNFFGHLANVTFTEWKIINRSTQVWTDFYICYWTDDDLGDAVDDKVGCDSLLRMGYTYNATNNDPVYGAAPPAVGTIFLRGAKVFTNNTNDTFKYCLNKNLQTQIRYKDLGMPVFITYISSTDPVNSQPDNYYQTYRYIKGLRKDGSNMINPVGNYVTKLQYSGDPVTGTGWNQPFEYDQRFMMSTGPVTMNPGDTQTIVFAQVIARGTSNLNSITVLRQAAVEVWNYYKTCYTTIPLGINNTNTEVPTSYNLEQNYPNPFNPMTNIKFQMPNSGFVQLKIFNLLGQEVATLVNEKLQPGTYKVDWDATNYPSGVYYYKLIAGDYAETKKMVLIK